MSQQSSALGGCCCSAPDTWWCPVHDRATAGAQDTGEAPASLSRDGGASLTGEVRPPEDEP